MLYRVFIALILLLCGYLIYDSAKVGLALSAAQTAEEQFIIADESAADPDVTVVAYIDYTCSSCRNLHPLLSKAIEDDGNVRLVPKPIVSKGVDDPSADAAKLAYAAGMQGKFREAHNELLSEYRVIDQNYISNFALEHGLDSVKLEQDMQSPEIRKKLEENFEILTNLKGKVLPTLLVNGEIIVHMNGPLPSSQLLEDLFDSARTL